MLGATRLGVGSAYRGVWRHPQRTLRTQNAPIRGPTRASRDTRTSPVTRSSVRNSSSSAVEAAKAAKEAVAPEPSFQVLRLVALTQAIPFVGFGFMDNAILIIAGDAIDTSLGVMLGISTMCAAAIGNIISDVAGIMMGTAIEDFCANTLKLPVPDLTTAQRQLRSVRLAGQFGCGAGMVLGCIIGMFPLLFIDSNKIQVLKREAQLESLFRDVVTEAKTLIGAESSCLWLRVSKQQKQEKEKGVPSRFKPSPPLRPRFFSSDIPLTPSADGDYLYVMYYATPDVTSNFTLGRQVTTQTEPKSSDSVTENAEASNSKEEKQTDDEGDDSNSRLLSLGRGIVSRAVMTAQPWNIADVHVEPDYLPNGGALGMKMKSNVRNMVCVPVIDAQGRPIAVIQAMNKKLPKNNEGSTVTSSGSQGTLSPGETLSNATTTQPGFTDQDIQILMALASHISVSLQSAYRDPDEDADVRLRDTIRILREQGITGISMGASGTPQQLLIQSQMGRRSPLDLFPE